MDASPKVINDDILPAQVRAARALLGLTQDQLADASELPKRTIARVELGTGVPRSTTLTAIRAALEAAGVEFLPDDGKGNPGVRLRGSVQWLSTHRGDLPPADRAVTIQRQDDKLEAAIFSRETKLWRVVDTGEEVSEASVKGWDMGDFPPTTVRR